MSEAQVFDLSITYDEAALRAAAKMLFWRHWKSRLRMNVVSALAILCGAGMFIYLRLFSLLWWIGLYFFLFFALWVYIRWLTERRALKLLGKSSRIRMTQADFSVMAEGDTHTFVWKRFNSFQRDSENFYLFIFRNIAYILPVLQVSESAIDFAKAQVGLKSGRA
jgi:hypothetical protein